MNDQDPGEHQDWVEDAKTELSGMVMQGMNHPSTAPVLTGAAVGAVAGWLIPFVSWPIGLAAGAEFALYQRVKK